ncbi:MAG: branched-chain amino acid ABC transporter permease [Eubacteriales bacterium]|jgi:branched-chain amino acid transport system permease protein
MGMLQQLVQHLEMLIQHLINGLQAGSIYALVALGYTMVYGIVKLINFAHGDFIMVGGYVCLLTIPLLLGAGMPAWLCILAAIVVCAVLGMATEKIAYKPLRGAPSLSVLITAIAVSLLLQNSFLLIFGSAKKPVQALFNAPSIMVGPIEISGVTIVTVVLSVIAMVALQLFVKKTRMGKAMRAVSEDSSAAVLMGINPNTTISLTFAIGSGLAAVAAAMYVSQYPSVGPFIGSMLGLKAFVAAVLGGIGILPGAMLGGIVIGIIESLSKAYISTDLSDAIVFGVLIVVLLVKPTGVLGKNTGEKV